MAKKQISIRISDITAKHIAALAEKTGMTQTEIISVAIDRMYREEIKPIQIKKEAD